MPLKTEHNKQCRNNNFQIHRTYGYTSGNKNITYFCWLRFFCFATSIYFSTFFGNVHLRYRMTIFNRRRSTTIPVCIDTNYTVSLLSDDENSYRYLSDTQSVTRTWFCATQVVTIRICSLNWCPLSQISCYRRVSIQGRNSFCLEWNI